MAVVSTVDLMRLLREANRYGESSQPISHKAGNTKLRRILEIENHFCSFLDSSGRGRTTSPTESAVAGYRISSVFSKTVTDTVRSSK